MAQITKIQKKLREAKFFFRHVGDKKRALNLESEELEFFLSAFLSASRRVTGFYDQKQNMEYRPWFHAWKTALAEPDRKLLNEMTKQRDVEVHEQGAEIRAEVEMVPLREIPTIPSAQFVYGGDEFGPPGTPATQIGQRVQYFQIGGIEKEVVGTCKRYVELLEKLLQDFEQAAAGGRFKQSS